MRGEGEGEDEGGPVLLESVTGDPLHTNQSPSHDLTTLSHSGQVYIKVFNMEYWFPNQTHLKRHYALHI